MCLKEINHAHDFLSIGQILLRKPITYTSPALKTKHHLLRMSRFLPCQKHDPFMSQAKNGPRIPANFVMPRPRYFQVPV